MVNYAPGVLVTFGTWNVNLHEGSETSDNSEKVCVNSAFLPKGVELE